MKRIWSAPARVDLFAKLRALKVDLSNDLNFDTNPANSIFVNSYTNTSNNETPPISAKCYFNENIIDMVSKFKCLNNKLGSILVEPLITVTVIERYIKQINWNERYHRYDQGSECPNSSTFQVFKIQLMPYWL